jgi:hypothetical protein
MNPDPDPDLDPQHQQMAPFPMILIHLSLYYSKFHSFKLANQNIRYPLPEEAHNLKKQYIKWKDYKRYKDID